MLSVWFIWFGGRRVCELLDCLVVCVVDGEEERKIKCEKCEKCDSL